MSRITPSLNLSFLDGKYINVTGDTMTGALNSQNVIPTADSTYNLGSTTLAFANLYVDTISSITGNALALTPISGQSLTVNLATTGDFIVNTDDLVVDTSTGNVGIGTTGPTSPLHLIKSSATADYLVRFRNDLAAASRPLGLILSIDNPSTTTTDPLFVLDSGATRVFKVETGGNVGIGTASPGQRLSIGDGTNIIHDISTAAGGTTVFNEFGIDIDFRVESDSNDNHLNLDAGAFSGVGATSFGGTADTTSYFIVQAPAITATSNSNFYRLAVGNTGAVTITGATTSPIVAAAFFAEPNITATGIVTDATTLYVNGAPTEGTRNWAAVINGRLGLGDPTVINHDLAIAAGSSVVFNESGGDIDFRIESDTNPNMFVVDAGNNVMGIGGSPASNVVVYMNPTFTVPADLRGRVLAVEGTITAAAGQEASIITTAGTIVEAGSGLHPLLAGLYLGVPTITAGLATVTNTATLYIQNAPVATVTGANYSLWIDAGAVRLDATTANGTVATVLGSVGPTGANTTVQEWLTIDINGTTRYLPCF